MIDLRGRIAWIHNSSKQVALWHAVSFLLVLLLPPLSWLGRPLWAMPAVEQLQGWVWGAAYLVFVTCLRLTAGRDLMVSVVTTGLAAVVCWGGGYAALALGPEVPLSKGVAVLAAGLGLTLGIAPLLLPRRFVVLTTGLIVAAVIELPARRLDATRNEADWETAHLPTSRHLVSVHIRRAIAPRVMDGGAIVALGDGFLVATAHGTFHQLQWDNALELLQSRQLALASPLNRDALLADLEDPNDPPFFRVTGMILDPTASPPQLYVAHQHWNHEGRCLTMRVSTAVLDLAAGTASAWQPVFETQPCLRMSGSFMHNETGGRLAWRDGRLLLSVGDHGFGLDRALAQDTAADYGKILELDLRGGRKIVSLGHRNPQGLLVDGDGRIWSTEHGPQGGDEINVIVRGGNYGWPIRTYGTQYGLRYWPIDSAARGHGDFIEPAHVFVPSVGVSAAIEVGDGPLSEWQGDLLIGSLVGRALFRARVRDGRVLFLERIDVRRRVRDIAQGSDGRIAVWTDEGHVLVLSASTELPPGEAAYTQCAGCHGLDLAGTPQGPSLRSVVGRPIARFEGFEYSDALRAMGGVWTRERLNAFLRAPGSFASGTSMKFDGVRSDAERRALIDYLLTSY
jgi:glucose/arabinose dehydrogenase